MKSIPENVTKFLVVLALSALVLSLFWQAGEFAFVNIDDNQYVYKNPFVLQGLTKEGVAWAFTTFEAANWHPLSWLSHMADVELFGPLLQVVHVEDFDSAIREANATRYGLSASLIGGTPEQFGQFWTSVRAGIINWNGTTFGMGGGAPFGGVGISGNHRPAGWYAADFCAYPVISAETEQVRAAIGVGLAPAAVRRGD